VLAELAENVVVPQPLAVIDPIVPIVNVGKITRMVSAACIGTFNTNMNTIDDGEDVTGLARINDVITNAGVTACTVTVPPELAILGLK